jgi:hypothetical protein
MLAPLPRSHCSKGSVRKGGRKLPDAIVDAVESLPWKKTAQLRRWQQNWEAWLEWMKFEARGWTMDTSPSPHIVVFTPRGVTSLMGIEVPQQEDVAAGADVGEVLAKGVRQQHAGEDYRTSVYLITRRQ